MMPYIFIILIIIIHLYYTTKEKSTDKILVKFMYLCQFFYFFPLDISGGGEFFKTIATWRIFFKSHELAARDRKEKTGNYL